MEVTNEQQQDGSRTQNRQIKAERKIRERQRGLSREGEATRKAGKIFQYNEICIAIFSDGCSLVANRLG